MSGWPELVTTALLGTGRRQLPTTLSGSWATEEQAKPDRPDRDPAVRVLELAARHRAVSRVGSTPGEPPRATAAEPAPPVDRRPPPEEAAGVLASLIIRPAPALINRWLACAAAAGCGLPAPYWTRLARVAAHSTSYDRALLGRVLGERGRWFLRQNPDWRRLAADAALDVAEDLPASGPGVDGRPTAETVRARPYAIFDHPDPWPTDVVAAAYAVLGRGSIGRTTREYAAGVGARLPVELYAGIGSAAEYYLQAPEASPVLRRQIRASFVILEESAFVRVRIEEAFQSPERGSPRLRRVEIPGV
jgi:hypothetical protein